MSDIRIATMGAAFSANKGAASMLQALFDNLPEVLGPCSFDVLTTYPAEDIREAPQEARIVSCTPAGLLFFHFPLAVLAGIASRIGIPRQAFCLTDTLRTLHEADLVLDVAGISFVDGRGIPTLAYNVLMTSTPLWLGKPVVKVAQALGPFQTRLNRTFASLILPRLRAICARGATTEKYLRELGLENLWSVADIAFCMRPSASADRRAATILGDQEEPRVAVIPSAVVEAYARRSGLDYRALLVEFIDILSDERGMDILLLPHSARIGARAGRMNDLPLCREIRDLLRRKDRCLLIDDSLAPAELRALIARCRIAVTSRFHGMVSALATTTPIVVVGWSHKYREVLEPFGLGYQTMDYEELSIETLMHTFDDVCSDLDMIRNQITAALPTVSAQARQNFKAIADALQVES